MVTISRKDKANPPWHIRNRVYPNWVSQSRKKILEVFWFFPQRVGVANNSGQSCRFLVRKIYFL